MLLKSEYSASPSCQPGPWPAGGRTPSGAYTASPHASGLAAGNTQPDMLKTRRLSELDFVRMVDWMQAYGPAVWRGANAGAARKAILASIADRRFDPEFWRSPDPVTDLIEVSYPSVVRPAMSPPNRYDPTDIAHSVCRYKSRASFWPYSQARAGGWPPLPGWSGSTDANRWFVDDWHAQRALTYSFPATSIGTKPRPWLVHLQGTLRACAEVCGLRLWFAPLVWPKFFTSQSSADDNPDSAGGLFSHLVDHALVLPPRAAGWSHSLSLDSVFRISPPADSHWQGDARWLSLKVSTRAPCGKYRAANAWARFEIEVAVKVYYPAFLG